MKEHWEEPWQFRPMPVVWERWILRGWAWRAVVRVRRERRNNNNRGGSMVLIWGLDWDGGNDSYTKRKIVMLRISSESRKMMAHHRLR